MFLRVSHPSATPRCRGVRLACVKHAASVRSEPGSNSQVHQAGPGRGSIPQTPLDRAPLTTLDAKRFLKLRPRTDIAPSRDSTGRPERKRSLASKRQMRLSKIRPLARRKADEGTTPRRRGAKSRCPKARRSGLQPHSPRPPDTEGRLARRRHRPTGSEGATAPLQQGARLGARRRQFQGPTGTPLKGTASRRTLKLVPRGPDFKTR